jgi:dihydrofolate reductase
MEYCKIEAILAYDLNNGISKNGAIPWKSKTDLNFFYNTTKGNVVIMGRATFLSLPENCRPLKNRLNIVLTSNPELYAKDEKYKNIDNLIFTSDPNIYQEILQNKEKYNSLLTSLSPDFKIIIIGGKQIYELYFPLCETVWVTRIKKDYQCDLFVDYDFENQFKDYEIVKDDDELVILKYFNL